MKIPRELSDVLASHPQILGGRLCFQGTRVPVETFLDYMESGYSLDRFLQGYKSVRREQALVVLHWQSHKSRKALLSESVS